MSAALVGMGCGGNDSDGPPNPPGNGDGNPPSVRVAFPPPISLTDATTITIRGSASDVDGVAEILVNGTAAQLNGNEWTANVPLMHGSNTITIGAKDDAGAMNANAAQLTVVLSANMMLSPEALVADVANNRVLVIDSVLDALLAVDLTTGERTVVSGAGTGTGPELKDTTAMVLDADKNRVLALDGQLDALLAIDLASGDRSVIADAETGEGDAFTAAVALALDAANNRVLVLNVDTSVTMRKVGLYAVALDTGNRTIIADELTGTGGILFNPMAVAIDVVGNRALVLDIDTSVPAERKIVLYSVDLTEGPTLGDRTIVSDDTFDGTQISSPTAMVLDGPADMAPTRALILDDSLDGIVAVDLATGERTTVTVDGSNEGPQFSVPRGLTLASIGTTGRALVVDTGIDVVVSVDLGTGTRSLVTGAFVGEGPAVNNPTAVAFDAKSGSAGRAIVATNESGKPATYAVDLASGNRTLISGDEAGSGPEFDAPLGISFDFPIGPEGQQAAATRALIVDSEAKALLTVDLASGVRAELSGPNTGSGEAFLAPVAVVIEPGDEMAGTTDRALVVDAELPGLIAVDLATGARTVVSEGNSGSGPGFKVPTAVVLERDLVMGTPTGRALVLDSGDSDSLPVLLAVDLTTGERVVVADERVGGGPDFVEPLALQLETKLVPAQDMETVDQYLPTGRALVVDNNLAALLAVDLGSGARTELSGPNTGKGPVISNPMSLALDPLDRRAFVVDQDLDAVVVIDVITSERVILTR